MGMTGHLRRVRVADLDSLLADSSGIAEFIFPDEGLPADDIDIDQTWHGLHFLLTGSAFEGSGPLALVVLGGTALESELSSGPVLYVSVAQVAQVADALEALDRDELEQRFDPEQMIANDIYPGIWHDGDFARDYALQDLGRITELYRKAASNGDAMPFYII